MREIVHRGGHQITALFISVELPSTRCRSDACDAEQREGSYRQR